MWFILQEHRACCNGPINTDGLQKTFGNSQIPGEIMHVFIGKLHGIQELFLGIVNALLVWCWRFIGEFTEGVPLTVTLLLI